jgi:ribonuclease HIII
MILKTAKSINFFPSAENHPTIRNMQKTITLNLTKEQEEKLFASFRDTAAKTPPYARWQIRPENCVITCYESGKTVFQGSDAAVYAAAFTQPQGDDILPQAGSDEVGTGDYFGPVCVCAAVITQDTISLIRRLGVRDSKQLSDRDILQIVPQILPEVPHSLLILPPEKYNEVHADNNMVALKSKMHNQAYVNLSRKTGLPALKVIDQFAPPQTYYRYLSREPAVIRDIHFETKAEDKYPSVGAASLIARYAFLKTMDRLSEQYGREFPKGAGSAVDRFGRAFVGQFGPEELRRVAKIHFKNTEKILKG